MHRCMHTYIHMLLTTKRNLVCREILKYSAACCHEEKCGNEVMLRCARHVAQMEREDTNTDF